MKRSLTAKKLSSSRPRRSSPVQLTWSHYGRLHRVTAWPEVQFEAEIDGRWETYTPDPSDAAFIAGSVMLDAPKWQRFLDFLPALELDFVRAFKFGRLAALAVITRCPALLPDLLETPALMPLIAAHTQLRGTGGPRWNELVAVHERSGLFGVLEWLGLPASKSTLSVLGRVVDPDLPRRLLQPIRAALWQPAVVGHFERRPSLDEQELLATCGHALAA